MTSLPEDLSLSSKAPKTWSAEEEEKIPAEIGEIATFFGRTVKEKTFTGAEVQQKLKSFLDRLDLHLQKSGGNSSMELNFCFLNIKALNDSIKEIAADKIIDISKRPEVEDILIPLRFIKEKQEKILTEIADFFGRTVKEKVFTRAESQKELKTFMDRIDLHLQKVGVDSNRELDFCLSIIRVLNGRINEMPADKPIDISLAKFVVLSAERALRLMHESGADAEKPSELVKGQTEQTRRSLRRRRFDFSRKVPEGFADKALLMASPYRELIQSPYYHGVLPEDIKEKNDQIRSELKGKTVNFILHFDPSKRSYCIYSLDPMIEGGVKDVQIVNQNGWRVKLQQLGKPYQSLQELLKKEFPDLEGIPKPKEPL